MSQSDTISESTPRSLQSPLDGIIFAIAGHFGDKSKEVERFLKFSVVGTIGAVVDFGTLNLLLATILPPVSKANVTLAQTFGFIMAVISNFLWNRYWTYPDSRSRSVKRQITQFTVISFVGWSIRTVWIRNAHLPIGFAVVSLLQILQPTFSASDEMTAWLGSNVALFVGIFVVLIWNFLANRYWTYNDVD